MENKDTASSLPQTGLASGFAGTLKNIQLVDLIQMCCLSASSLCMRVTKDNSQGTIFIIDGDIVHAACGEIVGEEAFFQILGWRSGSFESVQMTTIPQRTIDQNYNFLIMEAARRADEESRGTAIPSVPSSVPSETKGDDKKTRVLIVDDSAMMRKILSGMLTNSGKIDIVGTASNGKEAIALIDDLTPDLVTLDVNMPIMDGTSTLKHIMIKKPCPVVIMSNPGEGSTKTIFNFLELGAVDFLSKPTKNQDIGIQQQKILERVMVAATAKVENFRIPRLKKIDGSRLTDGATKEEKSALCRRLVVVVSGPGGHPDQMTLFPDLVPAMAEVDGAVVALQSLPPSFNEPFARYLFERCGFPASTIDQKTPLSPGGCYVGITGCPLMVRMNGQGPVIEPGGEDDTPIHVDRFLASAAETFKENLAVVLVSGAYTGEQSGLQAVRDNGGRIILRKRASIMVAEPLNRVADAGLVDKEVEATEIVKTVVDSFEA